MPAPLRWVSQVALLAMIACTQRNSAPGVTLTDQNGRPWSLASQHAPVALFFGYTHCADTCPATLAKLAKALDGIPKAEVAFVTVDPDRDTSAALKHYVARFTGAPVVGLTGTAAQIAATEAAYHVWSQKIPGRRGNSDYDEAHLSYVFLIDADGNQRAILHDDDTVETVHEAAQRIGQ